MRARGTGTVHQRRSDGRWVATWTDPATGKTRYAYGKTEQGALDRMRAAQQAPPPAVPTVGEWLWTWHRNLRLRESTVKGYKSNIGIIEKALGQVRLDELTTQLVDDTYTVWLQEGRSPASVHHLHRTLHRALNVAAARRLISTNPAALVDPPSVVRRTFTTLTVEQARAVLAQAEKRRQSVRWWLALVLGMRQGEVLSLTWDAVDLDHGTVTVIRESSKSKRPRTIPLPARLVQRLTKHRAIQQAELATRGASSGLVFTTLSGQRIDSRADWGEWKLLLVLADCPDVRLHDARHTAATLLFDLGVPAVTVAAILGHSSVRLTLDTYTHVPGAHLERALDELTAHIQGRQSDDSTADSAPDSRRPEKTVADDR